MEHTNCEPDKAFAVIGLSSCFGGHVLVSRKKLTKQELNSIIANNSYSARLPDFGFEIRAYLISSWYWGAETRKEAEMWAQNYQENMRIE